MQKPEIQYLLDEYSEELKRRVTTLEEIERFHIIDGKAVTGSTLDCKQPLVPDIFGIIDEDKTSCLLSWLKDNFEEVLAHLDQNSEEIRKYVKPLCCLCWELPLFQVKLERTGIDTYL